MARRPKSTPRAFGGDAERMRGISAVSESFKQWRPAAETLTRVSAVPTIFPQYNVATKVGGHPIGRVTLIHGQSGHGKTTLALGIGYSYLKAGHLFGLIDAERTIPPEWVETLMGPYLHHPGFNVLPHSTYEVVSDAARDYCTKIGDARAHGTIPEDTTALLVVDSLRKLFPKKLLETLLKQGAQEKGKYSKGIDGFGGRGGQIKAALNSQWMDEMIPMLADTKCALVLIAHETINAAAGFDDSEEAVIVGGGKGVIYDSSLRLRVQHTYIEDPDVKGGILGERHEVGIHKTKVGGKKHRIPRCYFHTSNGTRSPAGFDRARDVLELAKDQGVIDVKGSWFYWGDVKLGQGENKALSVLNADPAMLREIETRAVASGLETA